MKDKRAGVFKRTAPSPVTARHRVHQSSRHRFKHEHTSSVSVPLHEKNSYTHFMAEYKHTICTITKTFIAIHKQRHRQYERMWGFISGETEILNDVAHRLSELLLHLVGNSWRSDN